VNGGGLIPIPAPAFALYRRASAASAKRSGVRPK
jgi:hypothetical protein